MQVLNGETKGLGGTVRKGRPSWEKGVVGNLAMRRHVPTRGGCRRGRNTRVGYLMPKIFLLVGRSSRGNSKGGVADQKQCHWKSHWKIFLAVEVI